LLYAIGRLRLLPRPLASWAAALVLFLVYVALAGGSLLYLAHVPKQLSEYFFPFPWLADGVAVSLMLIWGTSTWPGVFLGSICVWGVLLGHPAVTVGADAVGEALSVVLTVRMLRAWHFRRQLDRLADPLILLAAALVGRLVASLADIGGVFAAVWLTPHSLPPAYLSAITRPGTLTPAITPALVWALARWQVVALSGIALTVPALLASPRKLRHALRLRALRVASLAASSVLWVTAAMELSATWTCWPLLLAAVLLVAWAAMEFGALAAALCTLLFACTAGVAFCQGAGPIATAAADVAGGLTATWGFIGMLCCVSPVLTVILTVRQHNDRRLTLLADRYRSLFASTPTPAWVADAESGAILMANVEAIRRYGYSESEFLRMRISELSAEPAGRDELPPPEGELVSAPLIKHLTRDGRVINVELVSTPLELDGRAVALTYAVDLTAHQDLRRRLLATVDRESFRVAQDLHDGLGHALSELADGSHMLLQRIGPGTAVNLPTVAHLHELSEQAERAESHLFQLTSGGPTLDGELRANTAEADAAAQRSGSGRSRESSIAADESPPPDPGARERELPKVRRFSLLTYAVSSVFIVAGCWLGGAISHGLASAYMSRFNYTDPLLAVPSLLAGVGVAVVLRAGPRYWPSVFIGVVLARVGLVGEPIGTALLMSALGTMGGVALAAWLRRRGFAATLDRWQDPLVLCIGAGATWALLAALGATIYALLVARGSTAVAPGVLALFGSSGAHRVFMPPALVAAAAHWWVNTVTGTVLVVPTLPLAGTLRRLFKESPLELCAWCACLALGTLLLAVPAHQVLMPLLTLSILLVAWAAARLGVALASLATLMFAMLAAGSLARHTGALASEDAATGVTYVWGFVGVLTVVSLFLAALLAEHDSRRRAIAAVGKRYRALFHGDPRPLWLHDTRTGKILDANEPAARAYGYSMTEFTALSVDRLLPPGVSHEALTTTAGSAVGPLAMKHLRKGGDGMDVEIWSYGTFLDGRRVSVCFAHDVTERNILRRLLFDRAEVQRRELATDLREALAGPLAELRIVAHKLVLGVQRKAGPARIRELLESFARQARRAAERSHEAAHRLSPLRASCGNLVAALHAVQRQIPNGAPLEISVLDETPLALAPQQAEHLFNLLSEILNRCLADNRGNVHVAIRSFAHTVRVAIDAQLGAASVGLARHPSVLLRARAMGARLWERAISTTHRRLVCDYPL
jgi:PAS domain S-box-containing protein